MFIVGNNNHVVNILLQVSITQILPGGGVFDQIIPGWTQGELVAAISAVIVSSANVSYNVTGPTGATTVTYEDLVLKNGSLTDLTSMVSESGRLSMNLTATSPDEFDYGLFFFFQKLSGNKNVHFASNGSQTIWDNGSYVVDHFSAKGAQKVQRFWEQYILTDSVRDLLKKVGNYGISPLNIELC